MSLEKVLTIKASAEGEWVAGVTKAALDQLAVIPESGFLNIDEEKLFDFLTAHMEFRQRSDELEQDTSFKQIIPYFVIVNQRGEVFSAVRKDQGGDTRLHGKRTIGFGGHLRQEDIKGRMSEWLRRELEEEIEIEEIRRIDLIGLIDDTSNRDKDVSSVHLGLFFEVWARGKTEVKEKNKMEEGEYSDLNSLAEKAEEMEKWSQIAFRNL